MSDNNNNNTLEELEQKYNKFLENIDNFFESMFFSDFFSKLKQLQNLELLAFYVNYLSDCDFFERAKFFQENQNILNISQVDGFKNFVVKFFNDNKSLKTSYPSTPEKPTTSSISSKPENKNQDEKLSQTQLTNNKVASSISKNLIEDYYAFNRVSANYSDKELKKEYLTHTNKTISFYDKFFFNNLYDKLLSFKERNIINFYIVLFKSFSDKEIEDFASEYMNSPNDDYILELFNNFLEEANKSPKDTSLKEEKDLSNEKPLSQDKELSVDKTLSNNQKEELDTVILPSTDNESDISKESEDKDDDKSIFKSLDEVFGKSTKPKVNEKSSNYDNLKSPEISKTVVIKSEEDSDDEDFEEDEFIKLGQVNDLKEEPKNFSLNQTPQSNINQKEIFEQNKTSEIPQTVIIQSDDADDEDLEEDVIKLGQTNDLKEEPKNSSLNQTAQSNTNQKEIFEQNKSSEIPQTVVIQSNEDDLDDEEESDIKSHSHKKLLKKEENDKPHLNYLDTSNSETPEQKINIQKTEEAHGVEENKKEKDTEIENIKESEKDKALSILELIESANKESVNKNNEQRQETLQELKESAGTENLSNISENKTRISNDPNYQIAQVQDNNSSQKINKEQSSFIDKKAGNEENNSLNVSKNEEFNKVNAKKQPDLNTNKATSNFDNKNSVNTVESFLNSLNKENDDLFESNSTKEKVFGKHSNHFNEFKNSLKQRYFDFIDGLSSPDVRSFYRQLYSILNTIEGDNRAVITDYYLNRILNFKPEHIKLFSEKNKNITKEIILKAYQENKYAEQFIEDYRKFLIRINDKRVHEFFIRFGKQLLNKNTEVKVYFLNHLNNFSIEKLKNFYNTFPYKFDDNSIREFITNQYNEANLPKTNNLAQDTFRVNKLSDDFSQSKISGTPNANFRAQNIDSSKIKEGKQYLSDLDRKLQRGSSYEKFKNLYKEIINKEDFLNYGAFINCIIIYSKYLIEKDLANTKESSSIYSTNTDTDLNDLFKPIISYLLKNFEISKVFKQLLLLYHENLLHAEIIKMVREIVKSKYNNETTSSQDISKSKSYARSENTDFFNFVNHTANIKNACDEKRKNFNNLYKSLIDGIRGDDFSEVDVIDFFQLDMKLRTEIEGLLEKSQSIDSNYNCYVINIIRYLVKDNLLSGISPDYTLFKKFEECFVASIKVDYFNSKEFDNLFKILNKYSELKKTISSINQLVPSELKIKIKEKWINESNNIGLMTDLKWIYDNDLQSVTVRFCKNDMIVKIKNNVALMNKLNTDVYVNNVTENDSFTIKNYPAFFSSEEDVVNGIKINFVIDTI